MNFAVIPVVVWWIVSALVAGGAAGAFGHKMYVSWEEGKGPTPVVDPNDSNTVIVFEEPMRCVDAYYRSITTANYKQYQFCVMKPVAIKEFESKTGKLLAEMKEKGRYPDVQPVRKRDKDTVKKGSYEGVKVVAISPWSSKEENYVVVKQGSSWKIVEEK